jgi:hypothetical protein
MDFEKDEVVNEEEIDALGIKKKDDADIDVDVIDAITDDAAIDPTLIEGEEKEETDAGIFGDDKELEEYMLSGYEENY